MRMVNLLPTCEGVWDCNNKNHGIQQIGTRKSTEMRIASMNKRELHEKCMHQRVLLYSHNLHY